jgi:Protein kinase domain
MDSKAVIIRFEAERQALALMDHPHIAKVFDAGTDDSGRPYFVMEYVKGKPITDYADQNHLTIAERLKLFEQVCQAVQHAHHKGVIHRDLKPGNVLVSTQDGEPFAKVIDFGVAKAISQKLTDGTLFTQHDQFIGTPQYMSPEQAEGSVDIDTRTDVYSLGVLLYELLTGSTPFSKNELKAAAFEQIKKMIIEVDPPKPSTRLGPNTPTLSSLATFRRTEPKRLGTLVQGELDWIVMKSIDKDRRRRYETPTSLANDILAHLNGEPVQAAPPSAAYRIQKFVRKNRTLVIGSGLIAGTLLSGIVGTTLGLLRARAAEKAAIASEQAAIKSEQQALEARDEATRERDEKDRERNRAERHLMSGLLRPIGFSEDSIDGPEFDAAELVSFVEWSGLGDPRLQLLGLQEAFKNSDTALRVARRSERVIQSCVGLSPKRRSKAIEFVTAQQQDKNADPKFRVAACWLALELGSSELPALEESILFLHQVNLPRFDEFLQLAVSSKDLRQQAVVNRVAGDALIALIEKPLTINGGTKTERQLVGLANRLDPNQIERAGHAPLSHLKKSTDSGSIYEACKHLAVLAPLFSSMHATRVLDELIDVDDRATNPIVSISICIALKKLAPRIEPSQTTRAYYTLIAHVENKTSVELDLACDGLVGLAPRLDSIQVGNCWDLMVHCLEKVAHMEDSEGESRNILRVLVELAPRLSSTQVNRAVDDLIILIEKSADNPAKSVVTEVAAEVVAVLAPRLEPIHVRRCYNALIAFLIESPVG